MTPAAALHLTGLHKRFGTVSALSGASLRVAPGEIHALLGENGAGKTTLVRVAYGLVRPDAGRIEAAGRPAAIRSPRDARRLGVGMVHQHSTAVPSLSVAENLALNAGWPARPNEMRRRARELAERFGLPIDPDAYAGRLSLPLKQRLEILKALAADATILLLDEPTAVLAPSEAEELLATVRAFVTRGNSAVLITHKLPEVFAATDRVTVLRRGQVVAEGETGRFSAEELAAAMMGGRDRVGRGGREGRASRETFPDESLDSRPARPPRPTRSPIALSNLDLARESGYGLAVRGASLTVAPGEIVGIAAVEGNGQRELLRAIAGVLPPLRGLREVIEPIGFIPEDRSTEGLVPSLSLAENITLGLGESAPWVERGRVTWREARARTAELIDAHGIVAAGPDAPAGSLSGGNQQKVVVARALLLDPHVVVAEEPTRGLDIAAAAAVHRRLREAAARGAAVVFHSSDLDEVIEWSGRIVVMAAGALREAPVGAGREEIGRMMVGAA